MTVDNALRLAFRVLLGLVFLFLLLPILMVVCTSFSEKDAFSFPPHALSLKWYRNISSEYVDAIKLSLLVACGTTTLATLVGSTAALALVRGRLPGKALVSAFCLSPIMVPSLVIGVAVMRFATPILDITGIALVGSVLGVIFAQSVFAAPFVVRAAIAGQAHFDFAIEEAALNLGASPLQAFFRVTLPALMPGIASGAVFAFIMSFDDVPVALFVGGGTTMTFPVKIYTSVEYDFNTDMMAVSTAVIVGSLLVILLLNRLIGLERFFGAPRV
jgi:putative spermidine/putrescine transport system permease protein